MLLCRSCGRAVKLLWEQFTTRSPSEHWHFEGHVASTPPIRTIIRSIRPSQHEARLPSTMLPARSRARATSSHHRGSPPPIVQRRYSVNDAQTDDPSCVCWGYLNGRIPQLCYIKPMLLLKQFVYLSRLCCLSEVSLIFGSLSLCWAVTELLVDSP